MNSTVVQRLILALVAIAVVAASLMVWQKLRQGNAASAPGTYAPPSSPPPSEVELTGIVRDFTPDHPDFQKSSGAGHSAGNVSLTLDDRYRPTFTGEGFRVTKQWRDADGNPIAPHMYNYFNPLGLCFIAPGIAVDGKISINNQSRVDSYDSTVGPYGGSNVGSDAIISTNSTDAQIIGHRNNSDVYGSIYGGPGGDTDMMYDTSPPTVLTGDLTTLDYEVPMPVVVEPRNLGSSSGDYVLGAGDHTISGSLHVDNFTVQRGARVVIQGNVTILCEGNVLLDGTSAADFARVSLAPGATLRIYARGNIAFFGELNKVSSQPERCLIFKSTPGTITAELNQTQVAARIIAPESTLTIRQGAEVYGTFIGEGIVLDNKGKFHVDSSLSGETSMPADLPGEAGAEASGGVASAFSFNQWFNDVPGVNLSGIHTFTMKLNGSVWEYLNDEFTPINDQLLGNESGSTNSFLTFVLNARFDYEACKGAFVEFYGEDDAWMYIDGRLVMDLGGIAPGTRQYVDVDRLGLEPDTSHTLRIFYAQRRSENADKGFNLRTNLLLSTEGAIPTINSSYD